MQDFLHEQTMRSQAARAVCCCCGSHHRSATSLKAPVHILHDNGWLPGHRYVLWTSLYSFIFQLRALRVTYSMELKQESEFNQSMANVNINSQNVAHNAFWLLGSALKPARNVHFLHAIFKKTAIFHSITSIFYIPSGQSQMVWNLTT